MSDLIDRGAAVVAVKCGALSARTIYGRSEEGMAALKATVTAIKELPTVDAVDVVRCKDCKHWKDSDGVYRRGFGAESKCPINLQSVYDGTFYCGMAERRQDDKR